MGSEQHLISRYVRERDSFPYYTDKLKNLLGCTSQKDFDDFLNELYSLDILKTTKDGYVFDFVGIIAARGRAVLKCYPKYLTENSQPKEEFKQVLKVIEKYKNSHYDVNILDDFDEKGTNNLLSVMLFLMNDYFENGVYTNTEEIIENNGSGEIFWDKTINETFVFIQKNRPYYIDLKTRKCVCDDFDFFKRLHECVLTKVSEELKNADILDLFDMDEVDLSDGEIDDFGDKDYILYRLENEINVQFNTRKQYVLKTIRAYIDQNMHLHDTDCLSFYGTNSFHSVWEAVCAKIFDDKRYELLENLPLPEGKGALKEKFINEKNTPLNELIEKPHWTLPNLDGSRLRPDSIYINGNTFIIFDAKYYVPTIEPPENGKDTGVLCNEPKLPDITKQFLYMLAYKDFIKAHGFNPFYNCFLMPTEKDEVVNKGEVEMEMFSKLGLGNIKVRLIPACEAYSCYLSGTLYEKLDLLENNKKRQPQ